MFHIVKDRIQDQAIDVKNINMFCGLPPIFIIMSPTWVAGKLFDHENKDR
jgi:hypothetical protein